MRIRIVRLPAAPGSLLDRLYARIERRGPMECHPWRGGVSRGGWREVDYGCIKEAVRTPGVQGRRWRVHRLILILKTAPIDVPRDDDEDEIDWLHRAARWYRGREAAHTCDWSLCANENHLTWQTHEDNVREQAQRRQEKGSQHVNAAIRGRR